MDLKIKDVADLLNVSETTIRRWLLDGKIPAYKINHQYRFSRFEIENWVMEKKLGASPSMGSYNNENKIPLNEVKFNDDKTTGHVGRKQFSLYRAIHKGGVFQDIAGNTKEQIIRATMKQIAGGMNLDPEVISELLLDRENLQPTALNNGIGVPHTRDSFLESGNDSVTVVFPKEPIIYGSLDGEPVHTLFFLFASDDKGHLHLLAKIAHLSSRPEIISLLRSKPTKEILLNTIKDWESSIMKVLN